MTNDHSPDPIDTHVGAEIKNRRVVQGMNQSQLGRAIGVTFQQVQKYEKGTNRVSASMLHRIAGHLDCEISDLFPSAESEPNQSVMDRITRSVVDAMSSLSEDQRKIVLTVAQGLKAGFGQV